MSIRYLQSTPPRDLVREHGEEETEEDVAEIDIGQNDERAHVGLRCNVSKSKANLAFCAEY